MKNNLHIFKNPEELASEFADQMINWIEIHSGNTYHLAISGGKSPDLLFNIIAEKYANSVLWQKVHFWWVDERMVSPDDPDSNFGTANRLLFAKINIPEVNIHRIKGENDPKEEAISYSNQIQETLLREDNWPVFDLILLGIGEDGHTASIFPDQMYLLDSKQICEVATQPQSGQKRVTLTGNTINHGAKVCILVSGANKAERIAEIMTNHEKAKLLPVANIQTINGDTIWYVDEAAAGLILT